MDPPGMAVDYGVYLVTDSTPAVLGTRSLVEVVEAALRGGAGVVQYRDKTASHADAVRQARALHAVTRRYGVPLLINDRVDVAVEVGCEGVHLGQDDMAPTEARALLGPDKIVGVTASCPEEAVRACGAGASYLGLGTVYATQTKKDTKNVVGPAGIRAMLEALVAAGHAAVPAVCIGGVNAGNADAVLAEAAAPGKPLHGVAVVSAVVAAPDPAAAARDLLARVLRAKVSDVMGRIAGSKPLSHNMTNLVVQNFAANVAIAVGASPIMANYGEEAADLARLGGALVINMGTVTPDGLANHVQALKAYNGAGRPVVLDPVGAGATGVRRRAVETLLSSGRFAVIKGNASELLAVLSVGGGGGDAATQPQRGVDSTHSLSLPERARLARQVARRWRCVALLTGPTDAVSDGRRTVLVGNGSALLGAVTGTGCTLGTVVSAAVAVFGHVDALAAAVAAAAAFGVAAHEAGARAEVRGPGSFVPAFIDALWHMSREAAEGASRLARDADVQVVDVADGESGRARARVY